MTWDECKTGLGNENGIVIHIAQIKLLWLNSSMLTGLGAIMQIRLDVEMGSGMDLGMCGSRMMGLEWVGELV